MSSRRTYIIEASLLVVACSVVWVGYEVRHGQARWIALLVAIMWCAFVWWFVVEFRRDLNIHPAGELYRSRWRGL